MGRIYNIRDLPEEWREKRKEEEKKEKREAPRRELLGGSFWET